jgi:hypothetical protein
MKTLSDLAARLNADADDATDSARAAAYRLRGRQVEDLIRYESLRGDPDTAKLTGFWRAPIEAADSHHIVKFHWDSGGLMAVEIARTDGRPLRLSDLRDSSVFPFRDLVRRDRRGKASEIRGLDTARSYYEFTEDADAAAFVGALAEELRERVEQSRSPYPPEHWEKVARVYSVAVATHDPAPVRRVAEELDVKRSTARNWVATCRRLGYLPPTDARKAKGNPI